MGRARTDAASVGGIGGGQVRAALCRNRRLVARWRVAHVCNWKVVEAVVNAAGVDQGLREVVVKIDLGGAGEGAV